MELNEEALAENLNEITQRIKKTAQQAGRNPEDITLIAVSKFHPVTTVEHVIKAGQTAFGENRVQEAHQKFVPLKLAHPEIKLHIIGSLQTNKAHDAVALADTIQTLDRPRLLTALVQACEKLGRSPHIMVQVNTGREPQKAGVFPENADLFIKECRRAFGPSLNGVMAIPPENEDPQTHFRLLRSIAEQHGLPEISMGMSHDFELAIAEGATMVRVGTAIFGARLSP